MPSKLGYHIAVESFGALEKALEFSQLDEYHWSVRFCSAQANSMTEVSAAVGLHPEVDAGLEAPVEDAFFLTATEEPESRRSPFINANRRMTQINLAIWRNGEQFGMCVFNKQ